MKTYRHKDLNTWSGDDFDQKYHHHVVLEIVNPYYLKNDGEIVFHDYGMAYDRETERAHAAAAQKLAREMNQRSFDENIKGHAFARYETSWYVSIGETEAHRLAEIDHTPVDRIKITPNVEILHTTGSWTLWSDGKVTAHVSNIPTGGSLTPDAARLINDVRGADGGHVEGGIKVLTYVDTVLEKKELSVGQSRGHYAREKVEEWRVRWTTGTESSIYIHSAGYFEGYMFDVYTSLAALAKATGAPGAEGISDFSQGFTYDPELGYVADTEE